MPIWTYCQNGEILENGSNGHFRLRFSEPSTHVRIMNLFVVFKKIPKKIFVLTCREKIVAALS
jgi:hypothetical protein